ncbi:DUF4271 domain-containing protein [Flavobacterium sp. CYK-55]|uniref:DUF4271 domain-containing protein n=1 Tax=Flavobacterium sp. CYK-55 TaxID=2835529 RepID=UPI001BD02887|nr:DUF4271 domain-containing protein [Flavobacterium sp. CYK-55]MBS7787116.1 DUF4271 domain-containing protein [Flavobacterium sp. CYK-55]
MMDILFEPRTIGARDWATLIFVLLMTIVVVVKSVFETRFQEFMRLAFSEKYIKVYRDSSYLMSGFTIFLFVVQLASLAFFVQLMLHHFFQTSKTDGILYIQILTFLSVFVLSKFLIEKIIGTAFNIEEFTDQYNLQKVSYRTYVGLLLLPVNLILFYNSNPSNFLIYFLIVVILLINLLTYALSLKNYQNLLLSKLFYFILYLCALEIAPYYFIYYWFTKS